MRRRHIVANILLADGIVLICLGFLHVLSTPVVRDWLRRQLTVESLNAIPMPVFLNHITVGMLMIPFGLSTVYSAAGVRVGHRWARAIAATNGFAVLLIPFLVLLIMGTQYFDSPVVLYACVLTTLIGLSMLLPLIWIIGDNGPDHRPAPF